MKFEPAIAFPVTVKEKPMKARVLEEVDNAIDTVFRVAFSDGFEDEFLVKENGNVYGSGPKSIPYARAIRFDICNIIGLNPKLFFHHFPDIIDGLKTNIWVIEGEDEHHQRIYKVSYFEFFRFALQKQEDLWIVSHKPKYGKEPDGRIVEKVGYLLNNLLEASR